MTQTHEEGGESVAVAVTVSRLITMLLLIILPFITGEVFIVLHMRHY